MNVAYELDEDLIFDFITECQEMLDMVEPEMLSASSIDKNLANKIFRPVHSMKGVAGSFGFDTMTKVAHASETFLSIFRTGDYQSDDKEHLDVFLQTFDFLRMLLEQIAVDKNDNGHEDESLAIVSRYEELAAIINGGSVNSEKVSKSPSIDLVSSEVEEIDLFAEKEDKVEVEEENESFIPRIEITEEMLNGFKVESLEGFDAIEQSLLSLMKDSENMEELDNAFRHMHSFKGNCGIFSLLELELLSHRGETIFVKIKEGEIVGSSVLFDLIVKIVDIMRETVDSLEEGSDGKVRGLDLYLELIENACEDKVPNTKSAGAVMGKDIDNNIINENIEELKVENNNSNRRGGEAMTAQGDAEIQQKKSSIMVKQSDIRVSTLKLDQLNNLMGELVTAKTMLYENIQMVYDGENEHFDKSLHFLSKTINDLQDVAVDIRMVPISGLFNKMIRVIHDISKKSGKNVNLHFSGEETEIDKTLIEKISDPLVHMIRNSVDHGIESNSKERIDAGKDEIGNVTLGASQEAGEVWIIIKDDGRGLNREKIIRKAQENGLLNTDGSEMSDGDVFKLVLLPGFSTAEKVTDISGRGVGMDVVMSNIKEMKGHLDIESTEGVGTTFTIKIPLTLAIIDGMLLRVGNVKYTLAINNIQEIVRLDQTNINTIFEEQQMIQIRGELIPVISLEGLYHVETFVSDDASVDVETDINIDVDIDTDGTIDSNKESSNSNIDDRVLVVITAGTITIALLVDELIGQHQTVVKPISSFFGEMKGISSCSILGDGEVSLILDAMNLVELSQGRSSLD